MTRGPVDSESDSQDASRSGRSLQARYTLRSKKQVLFEALSSFDINKMKSILQRIDLKDSVDNLTSLMDDEGNNLLHRAAYDNTFRIIEYLINYYKQRMA